MKQLFIIAILIIALINTAKGQIFNIKSFDGNNRQIHILFDDYGEKLTIIYLKDTLHIRDCIRIRAIGMLKKSFLKIIYEIKAGAGMDSELTLLLGVNGKTLCQPLMVTSFFRDDFIDYSKPVDLSNQVAVKTRYKTSIILTGAKIKDYKINVKIHEERTAKAEYKANYNRDYNVTLNFDTSLNVFYSAHQDISKYFTVFSPKKEKRVKQYIMGTFPLIKLGKSEYYYIKNEWYEKNYDDLSKLSYR